MVGRWQRRVAQRPVRGQSTHTYTHIRTRTSVTAGAVTHMFARMHRARGRRTSRREGGEGPRHLGWQAESLGCPPRTHTHMHTLDPARGRARLLDVRVVIVFFHPHRVASEDLNSILYSRTRRGYVRTMLEHWQRILSKPRSPHPGPVYQRSTESKIRSRAVRSGNPDVYMCVCTKGRPN